MPEFQEVFEKLEGRVAFLGLSQDQTPEDALALVKATTGATYDIGWDLDLEVCGATSSIAIPTTAFVSASGLLVDTASSTGGCKSAQHRRRGLRASRGACGAWCRAGPR